MRCTSLIVGSVMAMVLSLPVGAHAQGVKAPFEDHYADVNGMRLHYASVGQGPLVLFLHGYPSFWYQWKDQMLEMGRDHRAVGLDMRGYNLSSRPQGLEPYTMPHLVEDVRQFVEKINGQGRKFILVGHDWGANVAWVFAMFHPDMLEKLIIVNGAHPFISERELRENPAQRYASNYFFVFNKFLAPGEQPVEENDTQGERHPSRAHRVRRRGGQERPLHGSRSPDVDRGLVAARLDDRGAQLLPCESPKPAVQRSSSGLDDSDILVGGRSDEGRQVDDHPGADLRDLGDARHGHPVESPQRTREVGAEPERQALSRGRPLGDAREGPAGCRGHPAVHREQDLSEGVGLPGARTLTRRSAAWRAAAGDPV